MKQAGPNKRTRAGHFRRLSHIHAELGEKPPVFEGEGQENLYKLILEQDQAIVERQRPEALPLDLREELHVKGPDAIALEYRRFLAELGVDVA